MDVGKVLQFGSESVSEFVIHFESTRATAFEIGSRFETASSIVTASVNQSETHSGSGIR